MRKKLWNARVNIQQALVEAQQACRNTFQTPEATLGKAKIKAADVLQDHTRSWKDRL